MNVYLQQERNKATFSVELITNLLDCGKHRTKRRRQLETIIANDPTGIFHNHSNAYMPRTERHVRALAKHVRLIELCRILGIGNKYNGEIILDPDFQLMVQGIADDLPTALHWVMFVPNIIALCDEEQQAKWLPLCRDWKMVGCYAQTELGHGSNVRALETTATFLPESKGGDKGGSFIIHSPTLTSYKFWPGTLGRTANYAMVIAQLIDGNGVNQGIHNFLVPLRCPKTHELLPGIQTGDIGPKIGYNNMDNGYASFHHVKIPRKNMAMRFVSINEQGQYMKNNNHSNKATEKVAYITMMQVRAYICNDAGKSLAMACTIAIRYSAIRLQGFRNENENKNNPHRNEHGTNNNNNNNNLKKELQILDYKQQQYRLFPRLAASYCFFFGGKKLLEKLQSIEAKLINGQQRVTKYEVQDIHASSSGLKSYTTLFAADGIEDCRKACGGHGYLLCSGLPELSTTYLQNPTVEGDSHMLPQQVIKVLLKLVNTVYKNDEKTLVEYEPCDCYGLVPSLRKLIHGNASNKNNIKTDDDDDNNNETPNVLDLSWIIHQFRHRAARLLLDCSHQLQALTAAHGMDMAWNQCLILMSRTSKAYSQYLLLNDFVIGIQEEDNKNNYNHSNDNNNKSAAEQGSSLIGSSEITVLRDLARLLALYWMEDDMGDFLQQQQQGTILDGDGISSQQAKQIRYKVLDLLDIIRPNAVALVDARDFSDFRLKSTLGRYDGNVYEAIIASSKADPLNQKSIGPGYQEHLRQLYVSGVGAYKKNNDNNTGTAPRL